MPPRSSVGRPAKITTGAPRGLPDNLQKSAQIDDDAYQINAITQRADELLSGKTGDREVRPNGLLKTSAALKDIEYSPRTH
jgi:hypothetical protein